MSLPLRGSRRGHFQECVNHFKSSLAFLLLLACISLSGCRKDQLRWQSAERLNTGTGLRLNSVLETAGGSLLVVGGSRFYESLILTSRDGGASWQRANVESVGKGLYGCTQDAAGRLYAVGFDSKFLFSSDDGANWNFQQVPTWAPCKAIAPVGGGQLMIVGGVSFEQGLRSLVSDSGILRTNEALDYELNDIAVRGANGYLVGSGAVLKTADSGRSWDWQPVQSDNFKAVWMQDANTAYLCGYNGSIWTTRDASAHWEQLRNGNDITLPRYRLYDIAFADAARGWAVGEDGRVIYTDDGGRHWQEYERFTRSHLYSLAVLRNGSVVVCGEGGEVWKLRP